VPWAVWAKFILGELLNSSSSFQALGVGAQQIWLSPWSIESVLGSVWQSKTELFLACHLVLVTGVFFALNNIAIARATAAVYFGFTDKFEYGSISIYGEVVGGALGTCVLSGLMKVFIYGVDTFLGVFLPIWFNPLFVGSIIFYVAVSLGHVDDWWQRLAVGGAVAAVAPFVASKVQKVLREVVKKFLDGFNFFTIVVSGVTGNSFFSSMIESTKLVCRESKSLAVTSMVAWRFSLGASSALTAVNVGLSWTLFKKLGLGEHHEALILGNVIAAAYMSVAFDALYTAIMASLVCTLEQQAADSTFLPGSSESARKKTKFELEAHAMITGTCVLQAVREAEAEPIEPPHPLVRIMSAGSDAFQLATSGATSEKVVTTTVRTVNRGKVQTVTMTTYSSAIDDEDEDQEKSGPRQRASSAAPRGRGASKGRGAASPSPAAVKRTSKSPAKRR
jgi:hypothetical protein